MTGRRVVDRVVLSVVRELQQTPHGRQSSDDSGLRNAWDEICIQVQGQWSVLWNVYEERAVDLLWVRFEKLRSSDRAVLIETVAVERCLDREEVTDAEVISYLLSCLISRASDWTNSGIRGHMSNQ